MTSLGDSSSSVSKVPLASLLLKKSATVTGFFLLHYSQYLAKHAKILFELYLQGKISAGVDQKQWSGLNQVSYAIQWLFEGNNTGKIIVKLPSTASL
jgi:NADPH-dependent curcumin reductase CurA